MENDGRPTREDRKQEKLARQQASQLAAAEAQRQQIEMQRQAAIEAIRGPAMEALAAGRSFYRVELSHGGTDRAFLGHMQTKAIQGDEVEEVLAIVESVGWRLEHAGFVFVPTGQTSRDKLTTSGQVVNVVGSIRGIYLFRRAAGPPIPSLPSSFTD